MASYFPPRSSLSPSSSSLRSMRDSDSLLSSEVRPESPRTSPSRMSPVRPESPRSPSLLSQRASSIKRVVRKVAHDKVKSNDWNLVLDDMFKHLKKHGVTTKLVDSLKELEWETVHHVLKRALIISAVRWEIKHIMALFLIIGLLKDRFGSEIEEVKHEMKSKIRELIQNEELLEELRDHLL